MTSRLFQEVREARGLAYNVYSYLELLEDTGLFGMYMACDRSRLDEAASIVREQLGSLASEGVTAEELEGAKARLRAELILGSESMSRRMSSIAHDEIYLSRYCPPEEAIDRIGQVTREGVMEACREVMDAQRMHEVTLGP
jgi:predicted Zn-dependent peptidase